jgi:hypothetical protein
MTLPFCEVWFHPEVFEVTVTVEINAEIPSGAPDTVVRAVTENCPTLKFEKAGFEES